jgi:hypothetical protein
MAQIFDIVYFSTVYCDFKIPQVVLILFYWVGCVRTGRVLPGLRSEIANDFNPSYSPPTRRYLQAS